MPFTRIRKSSRFSGRFRSWESHSPGLRNFSPSPLLPFSSSHLTASAFTNTIREARCTSTVAGECPWFVVSSNPLALRPHDLPLAAHHSQIGERANNVAQYDRNHLVYFRFFSVARGDFFHPDPRQPGGEKPERLNVRHRPGV